jgi:hypothetical protein
MWISAIIMVSYSVIEINRLLRTSTPRVYIIYILFGSAAWDGNQVLELGVQGPDPIMCHHLSYT